MSFFTRRALFGLLLFWLNSSLVAQAAPQLRFVQNNRQWPAAVRYRAEVPGGSVFLTAAGFVYDWQSAADLHGAAVAAGSSSRQSAALPDGVLRRHAVFVDFVGANTVAPTGQDKAEAYHNYFLGNDPSRWAGHVPLFGQVTYAGLYAYTDLRVYGTEAGSLKYDFVVKPGGKPNVLALRYRGADGLRLRPDGTLLVQTSVMDVVEQRPVAYQEVNGQRRLVACRYRLEGNTLGYEFPAGYDTTRPLVIDPAVVACTYSGSTGILFGITTAGYDTGGNIYSAATAYSSAYPVTPGAYQSTLQGAGDLAISKFNPTGSQLLYATYLGGSDRENATALRTNAAGDLFVLAYTWSANYPTTPGCVDATYNPGKPDVVLTRLSATGTAVQASTFLGGSDADNSKDLLLIGSDVLVAGSTFSLDFPTTPGAYKRRQGTAGTQDGFVARLDQQLTTLRWSTLLGGTTDDHLAAFAAADNEEILVAGHTSSSDFPTTPGAYQPAYIPSPLNYSSTFITRLRADGSGLVASTFLDPLRGTIGGIDTDAQGNVVFAASGEAGIPATPGALARGGHLYVGKLDPALEVLRMLASPLPPTTSLNVVALRVDGCNNLQLAGSGAGSLPQINPLSNSITQGVYTMTLDAAGSQQLFGSYFGPVETQAYTEVAVSRFDARGNLYHNLCPMRAFPTTPGAYAPTPNRTVQDMVVFKISQPTGPGEAIRATVAPVAAACAPQPVAFANHTSGSQRFRWDFADGSPVDTTRNPTHVFQRPGLYRVQLIALGTGGCALSDTTYVPVHVQPKPTVTLPPDTTLCVGSPLTITANSSSRVFRWSTGDTTATIQVTQPGTYLVSVGRGLCIASDSVVVRAANPYTGQAPNIITPGNADGRNDAFKPTAVVEAGTRLRIYNRWGREVYSTTNYRNDWGLDQPAGVYYYLLENPAFCVPLLKGWLEVVR